MAPLRGAGLLQLLPCLLLAAAASTTDNETLVIGLYGPFTVQPFGPVLLAAAVLADLDFQKGTNPSVGSRFRSTRLDGTTAPMPPGVTIPNRHPKLTVRLLLGNDAGDQNVGTRKALDFARGTGTHPPVNGLVGGFFASIAQPVATVCTVHEVVNVAYAAQSSALSNKAVYPYFLRVVPPDSSAGRAMWHYLGAFGWRSASFLYNQDAAGESIFIAVANVAQAAGRPGAIGGIGLKNMPVSFDREVAVAAVQRLKLAGRRLVLVAIGGTVEPKVRNVMREQGVTSPDFQFFSSLLTTQTVTLRSDYEGFDGWHALNALLVPNTAFSTVRSMWTQMRAADVMDKLQQYGIDSWEVPLDNFSQAVFSTFQEPLATSVGLVYNAYYSMVLAFNELLNANASASEIRGSRLLQTIRRISFDGCGALVEFDSNLDNKDTDYLYQYAQTANASAVSWVTFAVFRRGSGPMGTVQPWDNGTLPKWTSGAFASTAPKELAQCPPGQRLDDKANGGAGACLACPEGTFTTEYDTTECKACDAGTRSVGGTRCEDCPPGKSAPRGSGACLDCAKGRYGPVARAANCSGCPKASYSDIEGSTACSSCPQGMETEILEAPSVGFCVCPANTYQHSSLEVPACVPCPEGFRCARNSLEGQLLLVAEGRTSNLTYPKVEPGYWTSGEAPLSVFRCESEARCVGGNPGSCAAGLEGRSCARCRDGLYWDGDGCQECGGRSWSLFLFPALPALLSPMAFALAYWLASSKFDRWGSWQSGVAGVLALLLNSYQLLDLLRSADSGLNVRGAQGAVDPNPGRMAMTIWGFTSGFDGIFRLACSGFGHFEAAYAVRVTVPLLLLLGACVAFCASKLLSRATRRAALAMDMDDAINTYLSVLFTFSCAVIALAFALFKCTGNPNGERTVLWDRSVICFTSSTWKAVLVLGAVSVLACAGIGSLFVWVVRKARSNFPDPTFQRRWKFLFINYRAEFHWWGPVFLAKNLLVNLGFTAFMLHVSQLYWAALVSSAYFTLLAWCLPFQHKAVNACEILSCVCVGFIASLMTWSADRLDSSEDTHITGGLAAFMFMPMAAAPVVILMLIWNARTSDQRCWRLAVDYRDVADRLVEKDPTELATLISLLGEWDLWYVSQFSDVIRAELLGEKLGGVRIWHSRTPRSLEQTRTDLPLEPEPAAPPPHLAPSGG